MRDGARRSGSQGEREERVMDTGKEEWVMTQGRKEIQMMNRKKGRMYKPERCERAKGVWMYACANHPPH